jgi:hemolysin activation/secretion protein
MSGRTQRAVWGGRVAGIAALLALAATASAQTPSALSGQPVPPGSPIQRILPPAPPAVAPGTVKLPQAAPENTAPDLAVKVVSVSVEGVTVYAPSAIAAMVAGLEGNAVKLPRIEDARLALLQRYRADGYPLVRVDTRLDRAGALRFVVTEGRIVEVKLDGDIGPVGTKVLGYLNHLTEKTAIDVATLERYLLLAQDIPGVAVQSVLRPSDTDPGALTLVAQVRHTPVSGLFTADNRAFRKTGPDQGLAVVRLDGMTSLGERTELAFFRSLLNPTQIFGQAALEFLPGTSGLRLRFYGGAGNTAPCCDLKQIGYVGHTTVFGAQASYPLIKARSQTLSLVAAFDATQSEVLSQNRTYDSTRVLRAGADYALQDSWFGDGRPALNLLSARVSQGLAGPLLGASRNADISSGRQGARFDFRKLTASVSREQTLFAPWDGATVSLYGLGTGQAANAVLPASEKFYLGGMSFTRGYYSGQVAGDNAMAATVELRLNTGFDTSVFGHALDVGAQFYGFYDWGQTWENQATDKHSIAARSAGGGVRLTLTRSLEIDMEGVARLTRNVTSASSDTVKLLPAQAFYWRVLGRF